MSCASSIKRRVQLIGHLRRRDPCPQDLALKITFGQSIPGLCGDDLHSIGAQATVPSTKASVSCAWPERGKEIARPTKSRALPLFGFSKIDRLTEGVFSGAEKRLIG